MDEIRIWEVDDSGVVPVQLVDAMVSESLLEKTLVENPHILMPGLRLVGRQTPTEGGPLDILGVDEGGKLVVFELKRGTLSRDAVAQVIDYASYLDSLSNDALGQLVARQSGQRGIEKIEDFAQWYSENSEADSLESLRPIRLVLVGLGVDASTERMVSFLAKSGQLDISLLTFHGFRHDGKTLLARQVRVDSDVRRRRPSREERRTLLVDKAETHGVYDMLTEVVDLFKSNWNESLDSPGKFGFSLGLRRLAGTGRSILLNYARVDPEQGGVRVVFFPRAIELCPEEFVKHIKDIPFQTWPKNREHDPLGIPNTEIQFIMAADRWVSYKEALAGLSQSVYKALQQRNQLAQQPDEDEGDA